MMNLFCTSNTTNAILLKLFTVYICRSSACAYYMGFTVDWFLLLPVNKTGVCSVASYTEACLDIGGISSSLIFVRIIVLIWFLSLQIVRTSYFIPLMQCQWNCTRLISSSSCLTITRVFCLNVFWLSYGPWIKKIFFCRQLQRSLYGLLIRDYLLVQFHLNCTEIISTKSSFAYRWHFPVQWFLLESWLFIFLKFVRTTVLLLMQFQSNYMSER
jgi:hypothetical protein